MSPPTTTRNPVRVLWWPSSCRPFAWGNEHVKTRKKKKKKRTDLNNNFSIFDPYPNPNPNPPQQPQKDIYSAPFLRSYLTGFVSNLWLVHLLLLLLLAQNVLFVSSFHCVVWFGVVWCGVVRCGVVCVVVWCGVVWCGVVWCGAVWCGVCCVVVRCGVVWCGAVWCGVCRGVVRCVVCSSCLPTSKRWESRQTNTR